MACRTQQAPTPTASPPRPPPPPSALGKLKVLDVSLNKFTGNVPAGWGGLYSLETLDMSHNVDLTGKLPAEWRGMKSIKTLLAM